MSLVIYGLRYICFNARYVDSYDKTQANELVLNLSFHWTKIVLLFQKLTRKLNTNLINVLCTPFAPIFIKKNYKAKT